MIFSTLRVINTTQGKNLGSKAANEITMSPMISTDEIAYRARIARELMSSCRLCPRECGVQRQAGERGYCGVGPDPHIASIVRHFGEEPPLVGSGGAGTIFFTRCNMRCVYCQNHQISQGQSGTKITPMRLAEGLVSLQRDGCEVIEPVSLSHQLPGFLEALAIATSLGLDLPVAYNTNGYEREEIIDLLDGIVDVYIPDLKYASNEFAGLYSDCYDYVEIARKSVLKMHAQVGNLVVDLNGVSVRGLIIRHLVLPALVSGTVETLQWIRNHLPRTVTVSLMWQYSPLHRSSSYSELNRPVTEEEYESSVDLAWELGLENCFIQDQSSQVHGIPDFSQLAPFNWNK